MKDIFEHALKLYFIIGNCKLLTIFQICSHSKISQSNNIILKSTLFVTRWNIFFDNSKIVLFFFVFVLKSTIQSKPVDPGRKLNVHKTFRRRPGRLMCVQFTSCVYGVLMFSWFIERDWWHEMSWEWSLRQWQNKICTKAE